MTWLNWPNRLSIARIVLVIPLVICLLNLNHAVWVRPLALGMFLVMAVSDALDGFLARRLRQETPLGKFLDPLADKLLTTSALILLAVEATSVPGFQLPSWVPVIAIGKDVLVVVGFLLVKAATSEYFVQPRPLGKACTLLQSVMVGVVLAAPNLPAFLQQFVPVLWWLASGLAVAAAADYLRIGNRFAKSRATGQSNRDANG